MKVTAIYADESTVSRFNISAKATVRDLKERSCSELAHTIQKNYPELKLDSTGSVILSSGSYGQLDFQPSATISSLCKSDEVILAAVLAPSKDSGMIAPEALSSTLASPIKDHLSSMTNTFHTSIQRLKKALKAEKDERREENKRERAERREEQERERAERREEQERERAERREEQERERAERELERSQANQRYEQLNNYILQVEETTMDTIGWITQNDTKMMDRIKIRHLLNIVQEKLAVAAGLTSDSFGASVVWRKALGPSDDLSTRLIQARTLLRDSVVHLDHSTQTFISSDEGLRLAVEATSFIRQRGDRIAHPNTFSRRQFDKVISCHPDPVEVPGLQALLNFACTHP